MIMLKVVAVGLLGGTKGTLDVGRCDKGAAEGGGILGADGSCERLALAGLVLPS